MDDDNLFAPHFVGDSFDAWKAWMAALTAAPMTPAQLAIYQQCTGRTTAPVKAFTEAALCVGRRGGKSRVLATVAVALATFRDYTPHLAPGQIATVMIIAPSQNQAGEIFRYCLGLLEQTTILAPLIASNQDGKIIMTNRVQIVVGTASFRVTRGFTFAAVLVDEIAYLRTDDSAVPDTEILRALRPGMASIPGAMLLLSSSPYAKKGELYKSYRKYHGKDDARVLFWKAPTNVMNPTIDQTIIDEAYEDDPEAAKAEYGAEFRDDLADYVSQEIVDACTPVGRLELAAMPGVTYSAFCDPSGGSQDSMTIAIAHREGAVGILDAVLEIRAPFDPATATAQCAELLKRYAVTRVVGDRYAGNWPATEFSQHGIELEQSAKPKSDIYRDLLPLLMSRRVELLDHRRMNSQLVGLERRTARGGRDSIDHPPGAHDDLINSVAGVLTSVDLDRRPKIIDVSKLPRVPAPPPPTGPAPWETWLQQFNN